MLDYLTYIVLYKAAKESEDFEQFMSDPGHRELIYVMPGNLIEPTLEAIYKIANEGFNGMLEVSHFDVAPLCRYYGNIPYLTAQEWKSGKSEMPQYISIILGYVIMTDILRNWKRSDIEDEQLKD